jgi:predicted ester cyclase
MLAAFPDIHFNLQNIVIGPQGVCEEAHITGTFEKDWLTFKASGQPIAFDVIIFFPWDPEKELFSGERFFVIGLESSSPG